VFWLLLLLFVVTLGIALAGQRLLERHSSSGQDHPTDARLTFGGTMFRDNMRGRAGRLGFLIGLVLALGGCGQLASQQPPVQSPMSQQAPLKLPPL
jgi:hypothetical protein